jgi:hypothetical protein
VTPKNVVAVTPGGRITMDHILGFYALFTVPDAPVSATKLSALWAAEGLPAGAVPAVRKPVHGFQIACRSVETRAREGARHEEEIKVDEVLETRETMDYQITRMVRDRDERVIEHPKAMRVTFHKDTDAITWDMLDRRKKVADELNAIGEAIRKHYEKNGKKVPGSRVRAAVRVVMQSVGATNVRRRSGGVYFVPKDGKEELDSLGRVLEGLYDDEAELHLIFAANAEGERALIEKHFTTNVSEELDELMAEVTGVLNGTSHQKGQRIRKDRVDNMLSKRTMLGQAREKYAALLDTNLSEVAGKIELLDDQLEALLMEVNQ